MKENNLFSILSAINVNDKVEKKEKLTYLSWTYAWTEICKKYPDANYEIKMFDNLPYVYDENTGYMVFTSVTIENLTRQMWLPVMDGANKAMKKSPYTYKTKFGDKTVESATMFDINKTLMRCLTKNLAMFGLGIYIYAGEDLPEFDSIQQQEYTQKEQLTYQKEVPEDKWEKVFNWVKEKPLVRIAEAMKMYKLTSEQKQELSNLI
jgi:hypothetical protein